MAHHSGDRIPLSLLMHLSTSPCDFGHRLHRLVRSSWEWNDSEVHRVGGAGYALLAERAGCVWVDRGALAQKLQRQAAHDHSCCPSSHPRISPILFLAINSTAMLCGEQHPCCVRQAPSNPSTMPVETKVIRPAPERVLNLITDTPSSGGGRNVESAAVNFLSPPFERGTVLRI